MTISLTVGATVVSLIDDLYWADEYAWSPVRQAEDRSLTGALIIDNGGMQEGRPITLKPVDPASAWLRRSVLEQLKTWAATPGQQMTLLLGASVHTVIWRHQEPPALSAEPVVHYSDIAGEDFYLATLKFQKVS